MSGRLNRDLVLFVWYGLVCLLTVCARELVNAKLDAMFAKGGNSQDIAKKEQRPSQATLYITTSPYDVTTSSS